MCPTCGRTIQITSGNTSPSSTRERGLFFSSRRAGWKDGASAPSDEAKRRFGQAADLFYAGRHGEALAIFDSLAKEFPGNADIDTARKHCLAALKRAPLALPELRELQASGDRIDSETVKRIVSEKMRYGSTEAVQLQAAEIAARMLGLFGNGKPDGAGEEQTPHSVEQTDAYPSERTMEAEKCADGSDESIASDEANAADGFSERGADEGASF